MCLTPSLSPFSPLCLCVRVWVTLCASDRAAVCLGSAPGCRYMWRTKWEALRPGSNDLNMVGKEWVHLMNVSSVELVYFGFIRTPMVVESSFAPFLSVCLSIDRPPNRQYDLDWTLMGGDFQFDPRLKRHRIFTVAETVLCCSVSQQAKNVLGINSPKGKKYIPCYNAFLNQESLPHYFILDLSFIGKMV